MALFYLVKDGVNKMNEKDLIVKKLEQELKDFKKYVKEKGVDFAIDKSYELTVKQEIIDCISFDKDLSKEERKALLKSDSLLEQCYDEWLSFDGNLRETLNFCVDKTVNYITEDYKKNKIRANKDAR